MDTLIGSPWISYKFLLGLPKTLAIVVAWKLLVVPSRSILYPFLSCSGPCWHLLPDSLVLWLPVGSTNWEHQQEDTRRRGEKAIKGGWFPLPSPQGPPCGSVPHYRLVKWSSLQNTLRVRVPVSPSPLALSLPVSGGGGGAGEGGNSPR